MSAAAYEEKESAIVIPKTPKSSHWIEVPEIAALVDAATKPPPTVPSRAWERGPLRVISSFMPETKAWMVSVSRYNRRPKDPSVIEVVRREFGMEQAKVLVETERQVSLVLVAQ